MKKIISILLILAMLFGLSACGAQTFSGDKLTADFKGAGRKKLTIVFRAEGLELYTRETIVPQLDDGSSIYTANLTKVNANDVTYKLVGKQEGTSSFTITFTNPAGSTLTCSMDITVDSKKKINFSNLVFNDAAKYTELDEGTKITYSEGYTKIIQLDGSGGPWKIGTYDDNIIDVALNDVTEDNQYLFLVTALKVGDSDLVLINKDMGEKVTFKFNVSSVDDENETTGYRLILTLLDFEFGEYSVEDDPEYQKRRKEAMDILEEFEENGAYIPDIGILEDVNYYNENGDPAINEEGEIDPEDCASSDISLTVDGNYLDYLVSKTTTFEQECEDIESMDATEVKLDLKIKNGTVRYYFTTYGFGIAIWQQGDYVSRLVFMNDDQTDQNDRRILYKFLGAEDEYKG